MKRFYKAVGVVASPGGHAIELDGKPVKTPAKNALVLPGKGLAEAVAAEWRAQGTSIDLPSMRLTRLANGAIDRVSAHRGEVIDEVCGYAETDLVCYRAGSPPELKTRQAAAWDPLIAWAEERHGMTLRTTEGILPVDQSASFLEKARAAVVAFDDFSLTGLHLAVSVTGSVVLGFALADARIDGPTAWEHALVDELWQAEQWGEEDEAAARRTGLLAELTAAARFLELCRHPW